MEYVCKVGTPTGEVVEQTFSAPDEGALRTELEQKGYWEGSCEFCSASRRWESVGRRDKPLS